MQYFYYEFCMGVGNPNSKTSGWKKLVKDYYYLKNLIFWLRKQPSAPSNMQNPTSKPRTWKLAAWWIRPHTSTGGDRWAWSTARMMIRAGESAEARRKTCSSATSLPINLTQRHLVLNPRLRGENKSCTHQGQANTQKTRNLTIALETATFTFNIAFNNVSIRS